MHVISKEPFGIAVQRHQKSANALHELYTSLRRFNFTSPEHMKAYFPSLDRMKYREKWWVIDVSGNNLRVVFFADFERSKIYIKHISTHAEYDKLMDYYRSHKE